VLKPPRFRDDESSVTGPRLSCHCASRLPRGLDVPHICDAWSDHHLTTLRRDQAFPAIETPGLGRVPTWLVAAALILMVLLPLSAYGVLSAPA
jgi:hypothetical protein